MSTDYARSGENHIPVQSDDAPVEDPIDEGTADSDQQLGRPPLSIILMIDTNFI